MFSIDNLLNEFIVRRYPVICHDEICRALELIDLFGFELFQDSLIEIITNPQIDSMNMEDRVIATILAKMNFILKEHGIHIIESATLYDFNELCSSLYNLQTLEDPSLVIYRVNAADSNEEIAQDVISYTCYLETSDIRLLILEVEDKFIEALKNLSVEESIETAEREHRLIINAYNLFTQGTDSLAKQLLLDGMPLTNTMKQLKNILPTPLEALAFFEEAAEKPANAAFEIWSLLLLSKDGYQLPLMVYRKVIKDLFDNPKLAEQIEGILVKMDLDLRNYRRGLEETVKQGGV